MICPRITKVVAAVFAVVLVAASGASSAEPEPSTELVWLDVDGKPLPLTSYEQVEEFLRNAEVVSASPVGTGVTAPKKLLLEQDGVRAHAIFKDVDELRRGITRMRGLMIIDLHDYHLFDCAAYQLDRLLGLNRVPPSVPRTYRGRSGTATLWLERTIMDKDRRDRKLDPPDPIHWERQKRIMFVFDNLIGNLDGNLTNVLIDRAWRMWFIDHSRAFNTNRALLEPRSLNRCERGLFRALEELDEQQVRERLGPYLKRPEIDAILARRQAILDVLHEEIEKVSEATALFDLRPAGTDLGDW